MEGSNIRYGLNAIKGVSEKSLEGIMAYNRGMKENGGSEKLNKFETKNVTSVTKAATTRS